MRARHHRFCDDSLACDCFLPQGHARCRSSWQIHINPAAETDKADTLARDNHVTGLHERHDPTRYQACDLRKADALTTPGFEQDMLAFIVFTCLVEVRIHEFARNIDNLPDRSAHRRAIDMDVEHTHENRYATHQFVAEPVWSRHFGRWRNIADQGYQPVRWCNDQIIICRRHADRIAKKRGDPDCQADKGPGNDVPAQPKKQDGCGRRYRKIFIGFGMNGWPLPAHIAVVARGLLKLCHARLIQLVVRGDNRLHISAPHPVDCAGFAP